MAGESDKVRWRGTLKIYPAIADLDAIELSLYEPKSVDAVANVCTLDGSAVPAGVLWVITSVSAYNNEGTAERIYLSKLVGATVYLLTQKATLVKYESVDFHGVVVLDFEQKIRAYINGCQGATDNCRLYWHGYQIRKY